MQPSFNFLASLLGGVTRSKVITLCGLIAVAVAVIDPGIFEGYPRVKTAVISIGLVATAVGRALLHGVNFDNRTVRSLTFLLVLVPLAAVAGCEKAATGARAGAEAVSYSIDEARAMRAAGEIGDAAALEITRALRDANDTVLEASDAALRAGQLDGTVAGYVGAGLLAFDNLNARGTLHIKNPAKQREWGRRARLARAGLSIYRIVSDDGDPAEVPPAPLTPKARRAFERAGEIARENRDRINEDLARLEAGR